MLQLFEIGGTSPLTWCTFTIFFNKKFLFNDSIGIKRLQSRITFKRRKNHGHCVKSVQMRRYFWSIFSCIRSEYRKIQTKETSIFGQFPRNGSIMRFSCYNFMLPLATHLFGNQYSYSISNEIGQQLIKHTVSPTSCKIVGKWYSYYYHENGGWF